MPTLPFLEEEEWDRVSDLFERLLACRDPAALLAAEPDEKLRAEVSQLWAHHLEAAGKDFLQESPSFGVLPVFKDGQLLASRFRIEKRLGQGGMGEVYLAFDQKLNELVAVKTISRLLGPVPSVRRRFVAEVKNARLVTHPNVCRIFDHFEDGEFAFFTMEYLSGVPLSTLLETSRPGPEESKLLTEQMAEGLHAAHQKNIIHGDFKPAYVIIESGPPERAVITDFGLARVVSESSVAHPEMAYSLAAGTLDYMAPELRFGGPPTAQSDVFAFGKVASLLLPDDRIWARCIENEPSRRPRGMAPILAHLRPVDRSRRYWIGSSILLAAAAGYGFLSSRAPAISLAEGTRLLVNGFRSLANDASLTRVARGLFLAGLQQSPRLRVVFDHDLLPSLRQVDPTGGLPLNGATLRTLLNQFRAAYWVDADIEHAASRYSPTLRLLRASDEQLLLAQSFLDLPSVGQAVEAAVRWLRSAAGESAESVTRNSPAAAQFTSANQEALQKYYEAMEFYARLEMSSAVPLLEEAIRLDPRFAQAHNILGMCVNSQGLHAEAFNLLSRAQDLAGELPERERLWIETNYWMLAEDPLRMVTAARRMLSHFPDEPRYLRILAHVLCRTGHAEESLPYSRRSRELAPGSDQMALELTFNLCEAGHYQEGLAEYERARAQGLKSPHMDRAAGFAYVGLEDYSRAIAAFAGSPRFEQGAKILQGNFESALASLQVEAAGSAIARNKVDFHRINEHLCGAQHIVGRLDEARATVRRMSTLDAVPPHARRWEVTAFWAAHTGEEKVLATAVEQLQIIDQRWPNGHTHGAVTHAQSLAKWLAHDLSAAEALLLESIGSGFSPYATYSLAEVFGEAGKLELAEEYWQRFEAMKGTVIKLWFPGLLVYGWLNRAIAAQSRKDFATAQRCAKKVLDHWASRNPNLGAVRIARQLNLGKDK